MVSDRLKSELLCLPANSQSLPEPAIAEIPPRSAPQETRAGTTLDRRKSLPGEAGAGRSGTCEGGGGGGRASGGSDEQQLELINGEEEEEDGDGDGGGVGRVGMT